LNFDKLNSKDSYDNLYDEPALKLKNRSQLVKDNYKNVNSEYIS
jgi:hypothetical protein